MKQVVGGSPCIEEGEGGEDEGRYYGRDHTRILQGREEGKTDGGRERGMEGEREGWRKDKQIENMCYLEIQNMCKSTAHVLCSYRHCGAVLSHSAGEYDVEGMKQVQCAHCKGHYHHHQFDRNRESRELCEEEGIV